MKKIELLLFLVIGLAFHVHAQGPVIRGKVTDAEGKPLSGATVNVKNTNISTGTDSLGNFEIAVRDRARDILIVSYVNFVTEELPLKNESFLAVRLTQTAQSLDNVVVVGYGRQRKRDVTGSISSVRAEDIVKRPVTRLEQALQGSAPGVAVQSSNGMPGTAPRVRVRGFGSITGNNDPLYVVDGFIGGSIGNISPADIESIDVLKDASASAIYGSRASNGVIIITTKSGKSGSPKLNVDAWIQKNEIAKQLDLMNAYDFAKTANIQATALGGTLPFTQAQVDAFKTNPGTNWQKELQEKPLVMNYQVSVSGGSENSKYYLAMNYLDQPGLIVNQYYKRAALRANLDFKITDKLNLKFYTLVAIPKNRNTSYAGDVSDVFASATEWDPTTPVRDPVTGAFILQSGLASLSVNPVAQATNQKVDGRGVDFNGTGVLTYRILKNLSFTSTNSYQTAWGWTRSFFGLGTSQTVINGISSGFAQTGTSWNTNIQSSNFLTYDLKFGDHTINLTGLYEYQKGVSQSATARASNLVTYSLGYYNLGLGRTQQTSSGYSSSELESFMGRLNYSYKDKYLLTASIRDDGSSRLTKKYSTFPSVALGWVLTNEKFAASSKIFSYLKFRASYGQTGNQAVGPYSSIPVINTRTTAYYFDGLTPSPSTPFGTPVPDNLVWETTAQTNYGFDASILKNRLNFSVDLYNKLVTNLLYNYDASAFLGGGSYYRNIGKLRNKGIELGISGTPVAASDRGKFGWTSSFNISFNQNKILNLEGQDNIVKSGIGQPQGNISVLKVGRPLGEFMGYKFLGTWKTSEAAEAALWGLKPGDSKFLDINGDHKKDLVPIGNGIPKYTWGFINDFAYHNFSLSLMFAGQGGSQIYSQTMAYLWGQAPGIRNATSQDATKMWTPQNQTDIPAFTSSPSSETFPTNSSRFVYNANFIKLKNLSLTYTVPKNALGRAKIQSLDVYVSTQNLFTITKYPGYDPELTNSTIAYTQGVEMGVIPNPRTYTLGFRLGL